MRAVSPFVDFPKPSFVELRIILPLTRPVTMRS